MPGPTLDPIGTHRDYTDEEGKVLKHVVTSWNAGEQERPDDGKDDPPRDDYGFLIGTPAAERDHASLWISQGYVGIVSGQIKDAEKKMNAAIIILAKVKQIDPQGFQETCAARALGQLIDGTSPRNDGGAAMAVAFVLNNLAPEEATSLSGGTDVTDRAMTRAKNAARTFAAKAHQGHYANKIKGWEESFDRSKFSHGVLYMNRADREVEVKRRAPLGRAARAAIHSEVGHMDGPAVRKVQTAAAAKAILGSGS
jgi:hypothetical protein